MYLCRLTHKYHSLASLCWNFPKPKYTLCNEVFCKYLHMSTYLLIHTCASTIYLFKQSSNSGRFCCQPWFVLFVLFRQGIVTVPWNNDTILGPCPVDLLLIMLQRTSQVRVLKIYHSWYSCYYRKFDDWNWIKIKPMNHL